jgi:hypothetical protein
MIRTEIRFFIEGNDYHNLCKWFAYLYYARSKKKVSIWSPQACHDFMLFEQWPGIPDMVITKTEEHQVRRTYVLEFENQPSEQKKMLKQRQFKRYSVTDVIVVPINKFKNQDDWKEVQRQVEEWLP